MPDIKTNKKPVVTAPVNTVEQPEQQQEQSVVKSPDAKSYQNIIKMLIAGGAKRINGIHVKNVNITDKENYTMISFTLGNSIPGYRSEDEGNTYKLGMTNTLFTSLYAITGALKEDEDLGWMANTLLEKPEALNLIFNGATIDLIQESVVAGEDYRNPFTTKEDATVQTLEHDTIINNIVGFKLGNTGKRMADRMADKLMGFN